MRNPFKKKKEIIIKINSTEEEMSIKVLPSETEAIVVIETLREAITFFLSDEEAKGNYVKLHKEVSYIS